MAEVEEKNRNDWVYKFRNTHGEITVFARLCSDKNLRAGFSFCHPNDFNLPHRIRIARGLGIATQRFLRAPVIIAENVTLPVDVRRLIMQKIIDIDGAASARAWQELGIRNYEGWREKDNFGEWFPAFMTDFRDEYYGRTHFAMLHTEREDISGIPVK